MPIVPLFNVSQTIGNPSIITLTDVSTGTDVAITQRRVLLQESNGNYLVPAGTTTSYVQWSYLEPSISINALDKDYALYITVQWLNVTNNVLYTKTTLYEFSLYNRTFSYSLVRRQASIPTIINDTNWLNNKIWLRVSLEDAVEAISLGGDISASQNCLDNATNLRINSNFYF